MTAGNVQFTQGSGTRLATNTYTEGGVTVHDEKMMLGENYLVSLMLTSGGAVSIATANSHPLSMSAGATNKLRIRRVQIFQAVAATTAAICQFEIRRLTTAGLTGTVLSADYMEPGDSGAGASSRSLPGTKGTESTLMWIGYAGMLQTMPTNGADLLLFDINFDDLRFKPLVIAAGTANGWAIKNVTAIAGASIAYNVFYAETTF